MPLTDFYSHDRIIFKKLQNFYYDKITWIFFHKYIRTIIHYYYADIIPFIYLPRKSISVTSSRMQAILYIFILRSEIPELWTLFCCNLLSRIIKHIPKGSRDVAKRSYALL